ncbi:Hypothetical protein PHPALM_36368 [Phytophthora palmivora]|uniref:Uncharacterized protein n=1 Tax=Phytophthora palmivora TaxID=4796 RepID=A0A2P4X049_9STRA|nr:Hypothetical protein PHPALM_36368 [Phytophthora palmivora]
MIEVPILSLVSSTTLNFFQFHYVFGEGERIQRVIGWADPRVLKLLLYPALTGCLFHFNPANRRLVLKLRISRAHVSITMERGVLDTLTVVPPQHVGPHGIPFATRAIISRCRLASIVYAEQLWAQYWRCFWRTWLTLFPVDVWNVHETDMSVVSQTNNPLERFNPELNAVIPSPHPSLPAFVGTIDSMSRRYVELLHDISNRRAVVHRHDPSCGACGTSSQNCCETRTATRRENHNSAGP